MTFRLYGAICEGEILCIMGSLRLLTFSDGVVAAEPEDDARLGNDGSRSMYVLDSCVGD
jgi:hypothetical protein